MSRDTEGAVPHASLERSQTSTQITFYILSKPIWGDRVFDLYLKYMGVKTLTPSLLVPFALIMGKEQMMDVITYFKTRDSQQYGGNIDIPILDHVLIGKILKIAGLTKLNFTPTTLVPLGLLMIIHDIMIKKKDVVVKPNGHVELPKKYLKFLSPARQFGGVPSYHSPSNPPGNVQWLMSEWAGQYEPVNDIYRSDVFTNNEMQLNSGSNEFVDVSDITVGNGNDSNGTNDFNMPYKEVVGDNLLPDTANTSISEYMPKTDQGNNTIWHDMSDASGVNLNLPIPYGIAAGGASKKKKKF